MKLKSKSQQLISAFIAALLLILSGCLYIEESDGGFDNELFDGPYEIVKIVDGDTIKLNIDGQKTSVRLIGIDTPESVHPDKSKNVPEGKLASDHTKELLENMTSVYIEYGEESHDRYGRVLAYVYLDKNTMLNAKILEDGYAKVLTIKPNNKYEDYFLQLEEEARQNDAGLWSTGVFDE